MDFGKLLSNACSLLAGSTLINFWTSLCWPSLPPFRKEAPGYTFLTGQVKRKLLNLWRKYRTKEYGTWDACGSSLPTCLLTHLAVSAVIKFVLNTDNEIFIRKTKYTSPMCVCIYVCVYVCICNICTLLRVNNSCLSSKGNGNIILSGIVEKILKLLFFFKS